MKTSHKNMQEMAEQGTFGGRFGGRKSLQSRKSGRFGGTFGGRKSQTETKVSFRGQLRQPNAASTGGFGGRKSLRLPNLVSPQWAETWLT